MTAISFRPGSRSKAASGAKGRHPAARTAVRRPAGRRSTRFVTLGLLALLLATLGVVMVLSAASVSDLETYGDSWFHGKRQVVWFTAGLLAMVATMRIDYRQWRRVSQPFLVVSIALLVLVLIPGVGENVNGATRWIDFGLFQFQPSEVAKLAVLIFCADILSRPGRQASNTRLTTRPVVVVFVTVAALVMLQPNLGTTLIIATVVLSLLFFAGTPMTRLAGLGASAAAVGALASFGAGYRRARLQGVWDPWSDPLHTGYQTIQAAIAVANGGLTGVGLGNSRGKWGFLPFAHTDFIFAIIAEEIGLIGAGFVVLAYLAIGLVGFSVALHAKDRFGQLLATGITVWVLVQAFVNISAVLGLLPITGVPLPFLSFGGTSLILTMASFGILLNVARQSGR